MLVYIKWSKTIQAGECYILIPLVHMPASPLCPKAAVLNMFAKVRVCPQDPAFLIPCHQGLTTLTHASFTHNLRCLLHIAGHNPMGFSGHASEGVGHPLHFWQGFQVN